MREWQQWALSDPLFKELERQPAIEGPEDLGQRLVELSRTDWQAKCSSVLKAILSKTGQAPAIDEWGAESAWLGVNSSLQLAERERLRYARPKAWNQTSDRPPEEVLLRSNASLGGQAFPSMDVWDRLQKSSVTQHLLGGEALWYPVAAAVDLEHSLTTDADSFRHIASSLTENVGGPPIFASAQHLALRTLYGLLL